MTELKLIGTELKLIKRKDSSNRWGFNSNDTIWVSGRDLGGVTTEKHRFGKYAVWHTAGYTGWAGVGLTCYYQPVYYVVEAKVGEGVQFLYEIESDRKTWRKCLTLCIEKVNDLAIPLEEASE